MIGWFILTKKPFQTMMHGADVIVCAIIGIVSWQRYVLGMVVKIALNSTESKPLTL